MTEVVSGRWLPGLAVALIVSLAVPVAAQPEDAREAQDRQEEIADELGDLEDHLDEAVAAERDLLDEHARTAARVDELESEVADLETHLASIGAELARAEGAFEEADARHRDARDELERTEAALAGAKDDLREHAVAAYIGTDRGADVAQAAKVLMEVHDIEELHASLSYLSAVGDARLATVALVRELAEQAEGLVAEAAEAAEEAQAARDAVAARRASVLAARQDRRVVRADLAAASTREAALIGDIREQQAEYEARIAELREESDAVAALLRELQRQSGATAQPGSGVLGHPIPGAAITSRFGPRTHPIFGDTRVHTGIDYGAPAGRAIVAAGAGDVISSGYRGGYGNTVIIDHGGGLATLYAHQSSVAVPAGAAVERGQVIGYVGSTGYSTGPHLHFEVRVGGNPVNPEAYL